jgi:hypothetical protein
MRIMNKYLDEKLTSADPTSKWISDFVHSNNPKFAGKSKKERIRMALGASYAAKGQSKNEEITQVDELKKSTLASYVNKAAGGVDNSVASKFLDMGAQHARGEHDKAGKSAQMGAKRIQGIRKAVTKLAKEEVEQIDELDKEPGGTLHRYLASPKQRQRRIKAAIENPDKLKKINKGMRSAETKIEKERQKQTGMNPQYQPPPPTPRQIQKMDLRYTHEQTDSVPASKSLQKAHDDERKKRGLPDPSYYLKLAAQKKKEIEDMKKEEVTPPFTPDKPKKNSGVVPGKHGVGPSLAKHLAKKGMQKQLEKNPVKEEVEELDELSKTTLASYAKKAARDSRLSQSLADRYKKDRSRQPHKKIIAGKFAKDYQDTAWKREDGYNKAIDRLAKEEVEKCVAEGSKEKTPGVALSKAYEKDFDGNKPGHNKPETALTGTYSKTGKPGGELKKKGVAEEVELDESGGPVVWKKGNDHIEKYGDEKFALYKNGKKTKYYKSMDDAKSALQEDGKLKGGAKDPCWKGYQMVGTKKKGGREVPNCVPREETELKSFKALREKLNGNC